MPFGASKLRTEMVKICFHIEYNPSDHPWLRENPFSSFKPGLHISCKDRKYIVANMYFKLYRNGLVSKSL